MSYDAKAFRIEHNPMDANGSGFVVELKSLMDIAEKLSHFALESEDFELATAVSIPLSFSTPI